MSLANRACYLERECLYRAGRFFLRREPVRIFVCEAVEKWLTASVDKSLTEQNSKLVHGGLPVEGGP
ncbi:hypothetical protein, partial [Pseudomonas aeruginosa]|uniref:hypothetical protein n=1 Tax=Pseudomonas aeruginosa TaxID=287 RepID=UPI003EE6E0F1